MRKLIFALFCIPVLASCDQRDKYDVNKYYDLNDQDKIATSIVTYIYTAPPYTKMEDRFKPQHRPYYSSISGKFRIVKYFITEDGRHYFYLVRPAYGLDKRGVGGHFRLNG